MRKNEKWYKVIYLTTKGYTLNLEQVASNPRQAVKLARKRVNNRIEKYCPLLKDMGDYQKTLNVKPMKSFSKYWGPSY